MGGATDEYTELHCGIAELRRRRDLTTRPGPGALRGRATISTRSGTSLRGSTAAIPSKLGGEFDAFQYVRFEYADPLGSLTFTNGYTNDTGAAPKAGDKSGDALASALLGLPEAAVRTLGPNRIDGRQKNYAAFRSGRFPRCPYPHL